MSEGRDRLDVPYTWPCVLRFAVPHPRTIYLDLNHWIGLAKAATGNPDGLRYAPMLQAARELVAEGTVAFPLSAQHYMEMSAIRDHRQRGNIASVMRDLSGYRTLLCRSLTMRIEVEAALDRVVGLRSVPYAPLDAIGRGFGHAFGIVGRLRISSRGDESDEDVRLRWPGGAPAYDALLDDLQAESEWRILRGPLPEDLKDLEVRGFDPTSARRGQERRAAQEIEQMARFNDDPRWRRGRIRDVVAARYMIVELFDMLQEGLEDRGTRLKDVFSIDDPDAIRSFVDGMPTGDVHVSLQVEAHRNAQAPWSANDIFDIDALALAVPFCDIVLADRRRARDLAASGCAARLGTQVFASPTELMTHLSSDPVLAM